ncbi:MAG: hypothetical protein SGPRY_011463 [Prymnesium sp.]
MLLRILPRPGERATVGPGRVPAHVEREERVIGLQRLRNGGAAGWAQFVVPEVQMSQRGCRTERCTKRACTGVTRPDGIPFERDLVAESARCSTPARQKKLRHSGRSVGVDVVAPQVERGEEGEGGEGGEARAHLPHPLVAEARVRVRGAAAPLLQPQRHPSVGAKQKAVSKRRETRRF